MKKYGVWILLMALVAGTAGALDTIWDGNGNVNASGNWSNPDNWDTGAAPTTGDDAYLPTVTDGSTRTVTVDSATTVDRLYINQAGATGVNRLSLNEELAVGSNQLKFGLSGGAGASQIQVNLNGNQLSTTGTNITLDPGTFNFNAGGSSLHNIQTSNAHWAFTVNSTINVTSTNSQLMHLGNGNFQRTGNGTIDFGTNSLINVSSGDLTMGSIRLSGAAGQSRSLNINNNGTVNTAAGTVLEFQTESVTLSNASRTLTFTNNANVEQAGTMQFRPTANGTATTSVTLSNSGTWVISGESAILKRMTTTNKTTEIATPVFNITSAGILLGNGAASTLEYDEEVATSTRMMINNAGTIQAGAGSQGSGLSSVGVFTFKDINLTNTGTLALDLGGINLGEYDRLVLAAGDTDPAGAGTFSAGGVLQLWSVNGFNPELLPNFSISLMTAGLVSGQFATIRLDGDDFTGNSLLLSDGRSLVIDYTGTSVDLALIPEPSAVWLVGISALALIIVRGRRWSKPVP